LGDLVALRALSGPLLSSPLGDLVPEDLGDLPDLVPEDLGDLPDLVPEDLGDLVALRALLPDEDEEVDPPLPDLVPVDLGDLGDLVPEDLGDLGFLEDLGLLVSRSPEVALAVPESTASEMIAKVENFIVQSLFSVAFNS
jgi:hypothetical protein